jgi:hypothetical protein
VQLLNAFTPRNACTSLHDRSLASLLNPPKQNLGLIPRSHLYSVRISGTWR